MLKYPISVFLDTNIFIDSKFDFSEKGIFVTLNRYISEKKIKLFISNIVKEEVKKHIIEETIKLCNAFKNVRTDVNKKISLNLLNESSISELFEKIDKESLKIELVSFFEKFLKDSKAIILDNSDVDCNQIIFDYFSSTLPFEQKDSKKHEFPDAIMVAKLKLLFNAENPLYVVSSDCGFRNSFGSKNGFTVYESIKEVFDLISQEDKIYNDIISFIHEPNTHNLVCQRIDRELCNIEINIDGLDYDRKGICEGYEYEEVNINDITDIDFKLSSVDDISEDTVCITLACTAFILATCTYLDEANSAWDSEEDEYIYSVWGTVEEEHQPNFECEVFFTITRLGEKMEFEFKSLQFDISLNQYSRLSRSFIEPEDPAEVGKSEEMEALEEYFRH